MAISSLGRHVEIRWHGRWPFAINIGIGRFGAHLSRATCAVPGHRRWRARITFNRQG